MKKIIIKPGIGFIMLLLLITMNTRHALSQLNSSLVGNWHFNQDLHDSSHSNDAIFHSSISGSSPTFHTNLCGTSFNSMLELNYGDYLSIPNSTYYQFGTGAFSLVLRMRLKLPNNTNPIVVFNKQNSGTSQGIKLEVQPTSILAPGTLIANVIGTCNAVPQVLSSYNMDTLMHCIALVRKPIAGTGNSTLKLYIDNTLLQTYTGATENVSNADMILIGMGLPGNPNFSGYLDFIRLYNTALTEAELTHQCDCSSSTVYPTTCSSFTIDTTYCTNSILTATSSITNSSSTTNTWKIYESSSYCDEGNLIGTYTGDLLNIALNSGNGFFSGNYYLVKLLQTTSSGSGLAIDSCSKCFYIDTLGLNLVTFPCSGGLTVNIQSANDPNTIELSGSSSQTITGVINGLSFSQLTPGNYTITATDMKGCSTTKTCTILPPLAITYSLIAVDCHNNCHASIIFYGSGGLPFSSLYNTIPYHTTFHRIDAAGNTIPIGSPNYSYSESDPSEPLHPFYIFEGLCAGTYKFTLTDSNGCTVEKIVEINNPPQLQLTVTQHPGLCWPDLGYFDYSISGGTPGYILTITGPTNMTLNLASAVSNQQTSNVFEQGYYVITVTDSKGCSVSSSIVLDQTPPPISFTATGYSFCIGSPGGFNINVNGGLPPYNLQINPIPWLNSNVILPYNINIPGNSNFATDALFPPGWYSLQLCDANNCCTYLSVEITPPPPINIQVSIQPGCENSCEGAIVIAPSGGTPFTIGGLSSYNINLVAPATTTPNNCPMTSSTVANGNIIGERFEQLGLGNYTVTVCDMNGCCVTTTVPLALNIPFCTTTNSMNISTGFNPINGQTSTTNTGTSSTWSFASGVPASNFNAGWANCNNPFPSYGVSSAPDGQVGGDTTTVYSRSFRLCSSDTITFDLNIAVDNSIPIPGIRVDGIGFPGNNLIPVVTTNYTECRTWTFKMYLTGGLHTLSIPVYNEPGNGFNPSGLVVSGRVSGTYNSIISSNDVCCCNPCSATFTINNTYCPNELLSLTSNTGNTQRWDVREAGNSCNPNSGIIFTANGPSVNIALNIAPFEPDHNYIVTHTAYFMNNGVLDSCIATNCFSIPGPVITRIKRCDNQPYTWPVNNVTYSFSGTYTFTQINGTCVKTYQLELNLNNYASLNFDGLNDYVSIPYSAAFDWDSYNCFTIECWLSANPTASSGRRIILSNESAANSGLSIYTINGILHLSAGGVQYGPFGSSITDRMCHHIAITRHAKNTYYVYIDNVLKKVFKSSAYISNTNPLIIGNDNSLNADNYWRGSLDEIRFWKNHRNQESIINGSSCSIARDPNLIASYSCDQGKAAGNNTALSLLRDDSQSGHSGDLHHFQLTGFSSNFLLGCVPCCPGNNNNTESIIACESYLWPATGITYTSSGNYSSPFGNLQLLIHTGTSSSSTVVMTDSYNWTATGSTYTQSGIYTTVMPNEDGCDSTLILNLTINPAAFSLTVLEDQSVSCSEKHDGSVMTIVDTPGNYIYSITDESGQSITNTLGTFSQLAPGLYVVTVKSINDTTLSVAKQVIVHEPAPLSANIISDSLPACSNTSGAIHAVITGGTSLIQPYLTYWYDSNNILLNPTGIHTMNISNLQKGPYSLIVEDDHLCFDTATIYLTNPNSNSYEFACGTFTWLLNGVTYTASGIYWSLLSGTNGCVDSMQLDLTIVNSVNEYDTVTSCEYFTWPVNGLTYTASGDFGYSTLNNDGCQDAYTLHLTISPFYDCYCSSFSVLSGEQEIVKVKVNGDSIDAYFTGSNSCLHPAPGSGSVLHRYSNFKPLGSISSLQVGATAFLSVEENECAGVFQPFGAVVLIDYNHNGSFNDPGEKVFAEPTMASGPRTVNGSFIVPASAMTGLTGMRVIVSNGYSGIDLSICGGYVYGETEDYLVNIVAPVSCTGTPAPGLTYSTGNPLCPNESFTLTVQNPAYNGNVLYQWYSSSDGTTWNAIPGATGVNYTAFWIPMEWKFRCEITCINSGLTGYSVPIQLTSKPFYDCYCSSNSVFNHEQEIFKVMLNGSTVDPIYTGNNSCSTIAPGPGSILHRYSNFKTLGSIHTVLNGSTVNCVVEENECSGSFMPFGTLICIDFNHNGSFTDPGERVFEEASISSGPRSVNASFIIPMSAMTGLTGMRVIVANGNTGNNISICGGYAYGETEDYLINIQQHNQVEVNIGAFLQGYYNGSGQMNPALFNQGVSSNNVIADSIHVELYDPGNFTLVYDTVSVIDINGMASATFPVPNGAYYVVVKHRNSITTCSANPVVMNAGVPVTVEWRYLNASVYGANQVEVSPGIFALYSGDINQDENIDLLDNALLENDINNFLFGYYPSDINGDGNVDILDSPLIELNTSNFVFSVHP